MVVLMALGLRVCLRCCIRLQRWSGSGDFYPLHPHPLCGAPGYGHGPERPNAVHGYLLIVSGTNPARAVVSQYGSPCQTIQTTVLSLTNAGPDQSFQSRTSQNRQGETGLQFLGGSQGSNYCVERLVGGQLRQDGSFAGLFAWTAGRAVLDSRIGWAWCCLGWLWWCLGAVKSTCTNKTLQQSVPPALESKWDHLRS